MSDEATPMTAAGRALLEREAFNSRSFAIIRVEDILAIEQEARQPAPSPTRETGRCKCYSGPATVVSQPAPSEGWRAASRRLHASGDDEPYATDWPAPSEGLTYDPLADKDRSAAEHSDTRSACPSDDD